jgi:predicted MFS family arabinose efflux permease
VVLVGYVFGAGLICLLFLLTADRLWLLYLVIFGYGALGTLTASAQSALLRDMLPDAELASGNGLLSTINQALRLLSPLLGTVLYVSLGPYAVVTLTALCFVVTAVLLVGVRQQESEPEPGDGEGYLRSALAGFAHIARTPLLARTTVLIGIAFGATGLLNIVIFPVIQQGLGLPAASLGVLVSVQGVGAVAGGATAAIVISRWGEPRVFAIGLTLLALGCAAMLTGNVIVAGAGMAAVGFGVTWIVVAFVTLRQRLTTPRMQGRTAAATMLALNLPQAVVTLVGATLLAIVDYRWLIGITAVCIAAAAGAAFATKRPPTEPEGAAGAETDAPNVEPIIERGDEPTIV